MTSQSKYLMASIISSILAFGCLITTSNTAFANVAVGNNQQKSETEPGSQIYTRQVYTMDEWPGVREKLCSKCQSQPKSEQDKVSVPEPSSVIALLILGSSLLLTKKAKPSYLTVTK